MESKAIHPAFRNRHAAMGFMKRHWIARVKQLGETSTVSKKRLLTRLKYLEKYSYE